MNILVVHDREAVADSIKEVLAESGVELERVVIATDGTGARRALRERMFDLLVIDLTLPHIHGKGAPTYQVVDDLLKEVFLLDDLKTPADIIGITRESAALDRIESELGSHVMTIIEEDDGNKWREKLKEKVGYTKKVAHSRLSSTNAQHDFDVAIITALDNELRPYKEHFEFEDLPIFPGLQSFVFNSNEGKLRRGVAFSVGKSGEARAATYTQSILSLTRPKLAMMTGICGGIEGKTNLGDLVAAESALDWDYGKWSDADSTEAQAQPAKDNSSKFFSRPNPVEIEGSRVHRVIREILNEQFLEQKHTLEAVARISAGLAPAPKLHLAPMASGSSVIASDAILGSIRGLNDAIRGIDMECFGFYQAAKNTHVVTPEFICIKSVSDYSNGTKNDHFHAAACALSSMLAIEIILNRWRFD